MLNLRAQWAEVVVQMIAWVQKQGAGGEAGGVGGATGHQGISGDRKAGSLTLTIGHAPASPSRLPSAERTSRPVAQQTRYDMLKRAVTCVHGQVQPEQHGGAIRHVLQSETMNFTTHASSCWKTPDYCPASNTPSAEGELSFTQQRMKIDTGCMDAWAAEGNNCQGRLAVW